MLILVILTTKAYKTIENQRRHFNKNSKYNEFIRYFIKYKVTCLKKKSSVFEIITAKHKYLNSRREILFYLKNNAFDDENFLLLNFSKNALDAWDKRINNICYDFMQINYNVANNLIKAQDEFKDIQEDIICINETANKLYNLVRFNCYVGNILELRSLDELNRKVTLRKDKFVYLMEDVKHVMLIIDSDNYLNYDEIKHINDIDYNNLEIKKDNKHSISIRENKKHSSSCILLKNKNFKNNSCKITSLINNNTIQYQNQNQRKSNSFSNNNCFSFSSLELK